MKLRRVYNVLVKLSRNFWPIRHVKCLHNILLWLMVKRFRLMKFQKKKERKKEVRKREREKTFK